MYAGTSTCPNVSFAIATLSQFMRNPGREHWEAVKCVLRYLKGMSEFGLTLRGMGTGLKVYIDTDWALQPHRHSVSVYVVLLNGRPIAWSAHKQALIALSTAEAKYIALATIAHEVLYLQLLLGELYDIEPVPTPIYCNNQAAIALASNGKFQSCTKHIDLRYHFIRSHIKNGTFTLIYCPSEDNIADALTKLLACLHMQKLRMLMSLEDCTRGEVSKSKCLKASGHEGAGMSAA